MKQATPQKQVSRKIWFIAIVSVLILTVVIIAVLAVNNTSVQKLITQQVDEDLNVLKSNDIVQINTVLFAKPNVPEEFQKFVTSESSVSDNGIMADLISMADIKLVSQTDTTVTLLINAPNMCDVGDVLLDDAADEMSAEDMKSTILTYAQNANTLSRHVTLQCAVKDDDVRINYNTPEFLNAVTGDFKQAYENLYEHYLLSLTQEVLNYD